MRDHTPASESLVSLQCKATTKLEKLVKPGGTKPSSKSSSPLNSPGLSDSFSCTDEMWDILTGAALQTPNLSGTQADIAFRWFVKRLSDNARTHRPLLLQNLHSRSRCSNLNNGALHHDDLARQLTWHVHLSKQTLVDAMANTVPTNSL
jgi:hypothetical protein